MHRQVAIIIMAVNFDDRLTVVPTKPNQPLTGVQFPKRSFGRTKVVERSCQSSWFSRWPFLHYDEGKDALFCHTCLLVYKSKKMKTTSRADPAFVSLYLYLYATPTSRPDQLESGPALLCCTILYFLQHETEWCMSCPLPPQARSH